MSPASPRVIIGRQPIYDRDMNVYAYELLFRAGEDNVSGVTAENADMATSRVINHAFMELGIERVIGEHIGFINLTRSFLLSDDLFLSLRKKLSSKYLRILKSINHCWTQ